MLKAVLKHNAEIQLPIALHFSLCPRAQGTTNNGLQGKLH
jgi:hypothetical protein